MVGRRTHGVTAAASWGELCHDADRWARAFAVEMQARFHATRGGLFAYRAGSGRRENRVSRWAPPRAPGIARNVRAAAALAGWLWRAVRRAGRAGGGAHGAWRGPSSLTTEFAYPTGRNPSRW